jgi:hypothetical protein
MLTATLKANLSAVHSSVLDLGTVSFTPAIGKAIPLTSGTGADQADQLWSDTRTLTASSTEDLDLAGSLVNALGATVTFARVRGIYVEAAVGNTNNVVVGGAASNGFINWVADATDKVVVRPGGFFMLANRDATGYAVTASTGDLLRIGNSGSGTSVTYNIAIVGCTA